MEHNISVNTCTTSKDFDLAKSLTKNYMEWLGMDLCFQNIDKEFKSFEQMYGPPNGCFIYVNINNQIAGGVGVRAQEPFICEMKRLFVYDKFKGRGIGKLLSDEIIMKAKVLGYSKMRLDTVSKLISANALYEKLGFYDIPAYYSNPDKTVRYMELDLNTI